MPAALAAGAGVAGAVRAEGHETISRALTAQSELPNVPGHALTAVTVTLAPGAAAAPHSHDAFVFVYVLEGAVRSQLDDEDPRDFSSGESWIEPPGVLHTLTQNLSETRPAKLLAVFVAKSGASLTTSGPIGDHR